jgi:hypothetical protein
MFGIDVAKTNQIDDYKSSMSIESHSLKEPLWSHPSKPSKDVGSHILL